MPRFSMNNLYIHNVFKLSMDLVSDGFTTLMFCLPTLVTDPTQRTTTRVKEVGQQKKCVTKAVCYRRKVHSRQVSWSVWLSCLVAI